MRKSVSLSIVAGLCAILVGCGGNQAACEDYVDDYNELSCVSNELNKADECPESLDDDECDLDDYYACLSEETTCSQGSLVKPKSGACKKDCDEE